MGALLLGEQSFGKGSVQTIIPFLAATDKSRRHGPKAHHRSLLNPGGRQHSGDRDRSRYSFAGCTD